MTISLNAHCQNSGQTTRFSTETAPSDWQTQAFYPSQSPLVSLLAPPDFIRSVQRVRLPAFQGLCLQAAIALDQFRAADVRAWLPATLYDTITNAVPKRQAEYAAGRYLVALALAELNRAQNTEPNVAQALERIWVPSQPDRTPAWPAGIIGSISHSGDSVICALSDSRQHQLLGVDTEQHFTAEQVSELQHVVLNPAEQHWLAAGDAASWLSLIFSAKESLYKALYPQVKRFFGFDAAQVYRILPTQGLLYLQLTTSLSATLPAGRLFRCWFRIGFRQVSTFIHCDSDPALSTPGRTRRHTAPKPDK